MSKKFRACLVKRNIFHFLVSIFSSISTFLLPVENNEKEENVFICLEIKTTFYENAFELFLLSKIPKHKIEVLNTNEASSSLIPSVPNITDSVIL